MNKIHLLFLVFLSSISMAFTQTVETFIDMAKAYNPELKALNLEYNAALQKENQVNDWPDPKLSLGIAVLPIETRLGAQRFKIGVSQEIPWKGLLNAKSDMARSMAEVKSNYDEVKEIDIEYAIRTAYSSLQFLNSKKDIIQERLKVLDALEELAKSSVRSGKGKLSDVLFTERKRELFNADLQLISKKMEQPAIVINRWSGRALDTEILINDNSDDLTTRDELINYAVFNHPQYQILNNQIAASISTIALTKFQVKPKINVGLDYGYIDRRKDVEIAGNGRDVLMPMGSISIPLHTGRYDAIKQEEAIMQEAFKAKSEEAKDKFTAEIELAFSSIEYANQVIDKFNALKEITNETLKLMRTEYASDGTRFEELLRIEMELIDYDSEILNAEFEKNLAKATLYKFK